MNGSDALAYASQSDQDDYGEWLLHWEEEQQYADTYRDLDDYGEDLVVDSEPASETYTVRWTVDGAVSQVAGLTAEEMHNLAAMLERHGYTAEVRRD